MDKKEKLRRLDEYATLLAAMPECENTLRVLSIIRAWQDTVKAFGDAASFCRAMARFDRELHTNGWDYVQQDSYDQLIEKVTAD